MVYILIYHGKLWYISYIPQLEALMSPMQSATYIYGCVVCVCVLYVCVCVCVCNDNINIYSGLQ